MLIHVDGSAVADAISGSATAARSHASIENLLLARFEGNHVVSLLPGDTAALSGASWSRRARRALTDIGLRYAEIARLHKHVPWSLELGLGPGFDDRTHATASGNNVIRARLHRFERSHTTAAAALLGENATDADLFQQLGFMRRADRRWEGVEMIHDARGTGGSTFAPEYERLAAKGHILLAIADTDQRHPTDGVGGTYHKLKATAAHGPDYQRAHPLPTRTAEGLVPLRVYREIFESRHGDQRVGSVARLELLLRSAPEDTVRYAHFKDGIRLYQVDYPKTEPEGLYWRDIATKVGRAQCTRSTAEQCAKRDDCKCYVVDALGDHALSDVVTWMKAKKSKRDLASRFDLSRSPALSALADEVLSWGLALPPVQT